jgi:hypothetical protein
VVDEREGAPHALNNMVRKRRSIVRDVIAPAVARHRPHDLRRAW